MSNSIKSLSVEYNPINRSNIFSSGDCITGQITLELSSDVKIDKLCVKLKGKAEVKWTENYGKTVVTYHKKEKFFSIEQVIIQKGQGNNVLGQGSYVYPFTFQIPAQELPSSFYGRFGKIQYSLQANLSRSLRADTKAKAKFSLIHKENLNSNPLLMTSQQANIDKKMKVFTSGTIGMDVNVPRTGFHQGEGMKVVACIQNRSSREIRPKYCLYQKNSYFAKGRRKVQTKDIVKEVGEAIPPSAGLTVTRILTIPATTSASILNCNILKVEFRLRVYLDVKYTVDPAIKLPIVILPALQEAAEEEHLPAYTSSLVNPCYPVL